jgi:hypothetical protein
VLRRDNDAHGETMVMVGKAAYKSAAEATAAMAVAKECKI